MAEAPFDLARAQRWFAVEFNNEAWDLLEVAQRAPEQDDRLLHCAHAACRHWLDAGNALNHLRALCLLSCAYHAVGDAINALRYGQQCASLSVSGCKGQTPFDRASALACLAQAQRLSGDQIMNVSKLQAALEAAKQLDLEEKAVFERFFSFAEK